MSSLTEISIQVRKIALWVILVLTALFVLQLLMKLVIAYWKATHPVIVQIQPPDARFNKLPAPKFTVFERTSTGIQFTLQNIEGRPPETTGSGRIYSMPKKLPSLLAKERGEKFAAKLGFEQQPELVGATVYTYADAIDPNRKLTLDITNMNFQLRYNYANNPSILFSSNEPLSKEASLERVKDYISANNLFDDTFRKGKTTQLALVYDDPAKKLLPAKSLSDANAIRFDFFRTDIFDVKVLPPGFDRSYTYAYYAQTKITNPIFELSYIFWPIALDDFATYPLRSGQTAWQDLLDGYAHVVRMGNNTNSVIIRNIYLAYYDSEEPQLYMQPIFVFTGDNNFVAYLPAVNSEWLE